MHITKIPLKKSREKLAIKLFCSVYVVQYMHSVYAFKIQFIANIISFYDETFLTERRLNNLPPVQTEINISCLFLNTWRDVKFRMKNVLLKLRLCSQKCFQTCVKCEKLYVKYSKSKVMLKSTFPFRIRNIIKQLKTFF